ncbi:MAG TPA: sugar transferase [Acidimicrobiia bacterium]|nr:sugar transferase [Acidimicrobiia bacterium]
MVSMVMAQGDFFREFFRSLFSANLFVTGVILTIGAFLLFYGAIYLFNATNLGKRLGFLVTGGALFGWLTITSMLFVIYAPRGPKPDNIEGLNAVEIRIIPITFLLVSLVLFLVFLVALHQYEELQEKSSA